MRLTEEERSAIKETIYSFDTSAKVYLFGSRVSDEKRGGDIDLIIISKTLKPADKISILMGLKEKIGEQKIDIIISDSIEKRFEKIVFQEALAL